MKKFLLWSVLLNLVISGSVYAAVQVKQFADVEAGSYYDTAVDSMVNAGVVKGYDDGLFHPYDAVNRAQAVTMFDRYDQKLEKRIDYLEAMICNGMDKDSYTTEKAKEAFQVICVAPF